jgi:DNA-binding PadR family transcriptional regulator
MIPSTLVGASIRPFVLSILASGPSYGYEIIKRVRELTEERIEYTTSTLYPVLHSLENQGLLESYWQKAENAPRRKYYRLTQKGAGALSAEHRNWMDVHAALQKLWEPLPDLAAG